jgi:hypothetical protein
LLAEADRRMYIVKQIHHEKMGIAETGNAASIDVSVN